MQHFCNECSGAHADYLCQAIGRKVLPNMPCETFDENAMQQHRQHELATELVPATQQEASQRAVPSEAGNMPTSRSLWHCLEDYASLAYQLDIEAPLRQVTAAEPAILDSSPESICTPGSPEETLEQPMPSETDSEVYRSAQQDHFADYDMYAHDGLPLAQKRQRRGYWSSPDNRQGYFGNDYDSPSSNSDCHWK